MALETGDRKVPLEGALNFRDLGGYPTTDGRQVRWRTLYRADGLGRLTQNDLRTLESLGLRAVIDLRTEHETEKGRFPYEDHPVDYHHLSVLDQTWDAEETRRLDASATDFLHGAYRAMLASGGDRFGEAIRILARPESQPAVFHCAAGKDRTGLLAALVLGAIGVEREAIVDDYTRTQLIMAEFVARTAAEDPERAEAMERTPPSFFTADGPAMHLVLDDLEREHGTLREYVRSIGVDDETLAALDAALIEDVS